MMAGRFTRPAILALLALAPGATRVMQSQAPEHTAGLRGVWIDVPFVRQVSNGCGAAVLSMVLQYWKAKGFTVEAGRSDAARIHSALNSGRPDGIPASALRRYLEESGFRAFPFQGVWDDLREHLAQGRPLIVCIRNPGPGPPLHYVVVAGVDPGEDVVLLNDPARRKLLKMDRERFEKAWRGSKKWTLLAVPERPAPDSK